MAQEIKAKEAEVARAKALFKSSEYLLRKQTELSERLSMKAMKMIVLIRKYKLMQENEVKQPNLDHHD